MSSRANGPAHLRAAARGSGTRREHAFIGARPWARIAVGAAGALLLLGALAWPLLFTNATFSKDWSNHLWYLWHESLALRATHLPSLFLDYSGGVFYPYYAYYGGTLYALAGGLSLALGDAPLQAYVLTYLLGFAAAYGGWYWLARMFGVRGWAAQLPGLVFVTSASYLTMVYGLGDWPEFLAVSAMPLMIAAGISVLRAPRARPLPAAALVVSSVVFFGSHILTAIWGTTVLLLLALVLVACLPGARRAITRRGLMRVLGLVVPSLLVSAWFLLPAAAYESQTAIAHSYPHFRALLESSMFTVAARHLFTLSRAPASGTIVTLALPVLTIAWVLATIAMLLFTRRGGTWMRALLLLTGTTVLLVVLMTHAALILALPRVYATLQFSFRLESYVLMGVSGALLAALVLTGDGGRRVARWRWLLAPIAVVSLIGAIEQVDSYVPAGNPSAALASRSAILGSYKSPVYEQEGLLDYVDDQLPILQTPLPHVDFPPSTAHGTRAVALSRLPAGSRVDTNLRASPDLLDISGARVIGTDSQADDVLELAPAPSASTASGEHIAVAAAERPPIVLGRILTLLAVVVLAAELGAIAARQWRRRS